MKNLWDTAGLVIFIDTDSVRYSVASLNIIFAERIVRNRKMLHYGSAVNFLFKEPK